MIVYRRLLAGFTSCISNLCFSHFCSIGPSGILASSTIDGVGSTVVRNGAGGAGAIVSVVTVVPLENHSPSPSQGGGGWGVGAFSWSDDAGQHGQRDQDIAAGDNDRHDGR